MTKYATTSYATNDEGFTVETHHREIPDEDALFRVDVSDNNGKSYGTNGLRWKTAEDAKAWGDGLALRWFGCTDIKVVEEATGETVYVVLDHAR